MSEKEVKSNVQQIMYVVLEPLCWSARMSIASHKFKHKINHNRAHSYIGTRMVATKDLRFLSTLLCVIFTARRKRLWKKYRDLNNGHFRRIQSLTLRCLRRKSLCISLQILQIQFIHLIPLKFTLLVASWTEIDTRVWRSTRQQDKVSRQPSYRLEIFSNWVPPKSWRRIMFSQLWFTSTRVKIGLTRFKKCYRCERNGV